ncbi:MAG: cysteine desulfurase [Myxococcales bacterium]|nr:cysteine desulfurase [Myxococcales bacterium]
MTIRAYLDNAATTAVAPEVLVAMNDVHHNELGNPSSRHPLGLAADKRLRAAREVVAGKLEARPEDVTFTSGGTEALALALLGTVGGGGGRGGAKKGHVLVSAIEHSAVRNSAKLLGERGFEVQSIPVDRRGGFVEPGMVEELLRPDTVLVAVMHVNNETGVEQPVADIADVVRAEAPGALMVVDAVQSFCKLRLSLPRSGADAIAVSAHKINGPKGVGALVTRPDLALAPLWGGGDQERSRRPGTENVAGVVGFAAAVEHFALDEMRVRRQMATLCDAVWDACSRARQLGSDNRRVQWITTYEIPKARSEVLVNALGAEGVFVSSGSACHGRKNLKSPLHDAMGVQGSSGLLRLSLGRLTSDEEIEAGAETLRRVLTNLAGS